MAGNISKKLGFILITALGLATAVFLVLIVRELIFQKPGSDPPPEWGQTPSPEVMNPRDQSDAPFSPSASKTEPSLYQFSKPPMQPPASISDQDLMTVQLNNEGIAHYTRGEYLEAADLFEKAYQRDRQNPAIRDNLAYAKGSLAWKQIDVRQYLDALLNFQSAIQLKPDEPTFFLGQGLVYHRLNEADRAIESLKQAIALNPKMPEAYKIIGNIYYERDEIEMAVGYYQKALELDPSDNSLQKQLAKAQREKEVQTGFQQEASRAFTVKFEGREEQDAAQRILQDLEDAYSEIGKAFSYYPQHPITVILYSDQQFRDVSQTPSWTKGVFDGKIRVPIGGAEGKTDTLRKVLFHEYTHALIFDITHGRNVPMWLNEGIAVYFESEDSSSRKDYLLRQIRSGQPLIPLSRLHGSFMGLSDAQASVAYAEGYAAVKTLMDRYGIYRIRQLLEDLGNQKEFDSAFSDQFMIPYENFQEDWQKTVQEAAR